MKTLITGGAGFVGSAVIRHIIGHTNSSVDKPPYADNLASRSDNARYAFEQVNIFDRQALDALLLQAMHELKEHC
jgi:dTDP-glucose 4,6-dehydratase